MNAETQTNRAATSPTVLSHSEADRILGEVEDTNKALKNAKMQVLGETAATSGILSKDEAERILGKVEDTNKTFKDSRTQILEEIPNPDTAGLHKVAKPDHQIAANAQPAELANPDMLVVDPVDTYIRHGNDREPVGAVK